ncbi:MAG: hypothetical protein RIR26_256, partial [Pseudomonadota bacterium]
MNFAFFRKSLKLSTAATRTVAASQLFVLFLVACSSGGVKEGGSLDWSVSILEGSKQISLPRRAFDKPILIQVKDSSGEPVIDAPVEFRLVDSELTGVDNIAVETLEKAWNTETAKLTSSDPSVRSAAVGPNNQRTSKAQEFVEERVGRIEQSDLRTNKDGRARVWMVAPTYFNRRITVIARVGGEDGFGANYAYAFVSTSAVRDGTRLFITTTNAREEAVGAEFDIYLSVEDKEGRIAATYEGRKKVQIEASPKSSWAQFQPDFPTGVQECDFSGGRCLMPRGPFILRVPEQLNVKVTLLDDSMDPIEEKIIVNGTNEKAFLALKDLPGPPLENSKPLESLTIPPGKVVDLYAAWIDASGNYLGDAENAVWATDSERLALAMSTTRGKKVTFAPRKTATGLLSVTEDNKQLIRPFPIIVPASEIASWRFRIAGVEPLLDENLKEIPPVVKAGECVDVDVYGSDAYGNMVPNLNGESFLTLKIENADTDAVLAQDAHWNEGSAELIDQKIKFTDGLAKSVRKACFYDATHAAGTAPQITVRGSNPITAKTLNGSIQMDIRKGLPKKIILTRADIPNATFDSAIDVCNRFTAQNLNPSDSRGPCLILGPRKFQQPVDENDSATSDELLSQNFRAAVVDGAGNFIKYVKMIQVLGQDKSQEAKITPKMESLGTQQIEQYNILADRSSNLTRRMILSYDESSNTLSAEDKKSIEGLTISYDYRVASRNPVSILPFFVYGENLNNRLGAITAGKKFRVRAELKDAQGASVSYKKNTVRSSRHVSLDYDQLYPYNTSFSIETLKFLSPDDCHLKEANQLASASGFGNGMHQTVIDSKDDIDSSKFLPLITEGIADLGAGVEFQLNRANTGANAACETKMQMSITLDDNSNVRLIAPDVVVTVRAEPVISKIQLRSQPNNEGMNMNDLLECNIFLSDIKTSSSFKSTQCHDVMTTSNTAVGKTFYITGFDRFKNSTSGDPNVQADETVEFNWVNSPTVESAARYENLGAFDSFLQASPDYKYLLEDVSDLTTDSPRAKRIYVSGTFLKSSPNHRPASGGGFLEAKLVSNRDVRAYSRVMNFTSETASKFVVDFIQPNATSNPTVYWSSADNNELGNASAGRQIPAGTDFAIRLRPVDEINTPTNSYWGTKRILISIDEFATWGDPLKRSKQGTNSDSGKKLLFTFDCTFADPAAGKYLGDTIRINNYPVSGVYDDPECILKTADGKAERVFTLINTREIYDIQIEEIENQYTTINRFLVSARPIPNLFLDKKIVAASECGGPDVGAKLWDENQLGLVNSATNSTVYRTGSFPDYRYRISADESLEFHPALTDALGNYLSDAPLVSIAESGAPSGSNDELRSTPHSACRPDGVKWTFFANTANDTEPLPLTLGFSQAGIDVSNSLSIRLDIIPGLPNNLAVELARPRSAVSDPVIIPPKDENGKTIVTAGSCFSPRVRVRDQDGNQVRAFSQPVTINFGLENYYSKENENTKELIHPGGLYRFRKIDSTYIPYTTLDYSHTESDTMYRGTSENPILWYEPSGYDWPSRMEPQALRYYASEKSSRFVTGGEVNLIDRYICLMDATTGLFPNLKVGIDPSAGNLPPTIFGESRLFQDVVVEPGAASLVDFRQAVDATTERICHQPYSETGFPVFRIQNQDPLFDKPVVLTCRSLQVTETPIQINAYFTDKVGNLVKKGSINAGTASGSWNVIQVPLDTKVCDVADGNGSACSANLNLTRMKRKGSIDALWIPPPEASGTYGMHEIKLVVRSGEPEKFKVDPIRLPMTTDNAFGFDLKLLDVFDNEYDAPTTFNFSATASMSYTGQYSTPAGAAPPNLNPQLTVLMPTSVPLTFRGSHIASTSEIFRIRKVNGLSPAGVTFSMKVSSNSEVSPFQASYALSIIPGQPYTNELYFPDGVVPLPSLSDRADALVRLTSANVEQQFEIRSLDQSGNTTASPAVTFAYVGASTLAPLKPHLYKNYAMYLPLSQAGIGEIQATLQSNTAVQSPIYRVQVAPANASRLKLVRVNADGTSMGDSSPNPALTAGDDVYFKVIATDDQDNLVGEFNRQDVKMVWGYGTYPTRSEGARTRLPGCATDSCSDTSVMVAGCQIRGGVCRTSYDDTAPAVIFNVKAYGSTAGKSGVLSVKAEWTSPELRLEEYFGSYGIVVNPGAFHHFGVTPSTTDTEARADLSALLSVTVDARDFYGNTLSMASQPNTVKNAPITLVLRREDGITSSTGTLYGQPATPPSFGNNDNLVLNNLAYDEGGYFRIKATSNSDFGLSTNVASPVVNFKAVEATIKEYRLVFNSGLNEYVAGQEYFFRLMAVDNYLKPVRGIDDILRSHTYEWSGLGAASVSNGLARPADTMPVQFNSETTGAFIEGIAVFKGTFYKASSYLQTLPSNSIGLKNKRSTADTADDKTVVVTSGSAQAISEIRIVPAVLKQYNVITTANSRTDLTSLTNNFSIQATASGLFRIVIQPLDEFGNLRTGENGIRLAPNTGASSLTATVARQATNPDFSTGALNLSANAVANVGYTFKDLYYRVAHPVSWGLSGVGAGITVVPTVTLNYTPQLETVQSYKLKFDGTEAAKTILAGTGFTLRMEALDEVGNIVSGTGIGTTLSGRTFTVTGPSSIGTYTPTSLASFTFTDAGVADKANVKFYKAETFPAGTFQIQEDGSARAGKNTAALTIDPETVNGLNIQVIPPQRAAVPWNFVSWAQDIYGNPSSRGCADPSSNGTFPLTLKGVLMDGITPDSLASSGAGGGVATAAFANPSAGILINKGSTTGYYNTPLTLYKRGENMLRLEGCNKTSNVVVVVNEALKANVLRISNTSAAPASTLTAVQECYPTNATGAAVSCPTLYAYLWDEYGNLWRDGEAACGWNYYSLVPATPVSPAGTVSGLVTTNSSVTLQSTGHMNGQLRCTIAGSDTKSGSPLVADVSVYGGVAGLGGRNTNDTLITSGITTNPADLSTISVGDNNLKITQITLMQYRGGTVDGAGNITAPGTLQAVNRTRTEEYTFTPTGSIPASMMPTNLIRNHDANGNITSQFWFSFKSPLQGNITVSTRGVSSVLTNVSVGISAPQTLRVGRFMVGTEEKQSVVAGDKITLESLEVLDSSGNRVCNQAADPAVIEAASVMVPPVCGNDLSCNTTLATLPGSKPLNFDQYGLTETGNRKTFPIATEPGYWANNISFKLYRSSLATKITVRACGLSKDFFFSVSAAPLDAARLAASEEPPSYAIATPDVNCPLGDGVSVRCPSIKAFFWDAYGNPFINGDCNTWGFERPAGSTGHTAGTGAGQFALAANDTVRTTITTANSAYLSGRLSCNADNGVVAQALVYGGLTSLSSTHTFGGVAAATTAVAAADNFTIGTVTAKFKRPVVVSGLLTEQEVVKNDFTDNIPETLTFGTASGTLTETVLPVASTSTSFACTFNTSGVCTPLAGLAVLSFRKVESSPRVITLNLRGITQTVGSFSVTPRGANTLQAAFLTDLSNSNSAVTESVPMNANSSVAASLKIFDEFGNPTSIPTGQTSGECTVAANDVTATDSDGNALTTTTARLTDATRLLQKTATGVYSIAHNQNFGGGALGLTIMKAGTNTVTFRGCGKQTSFPVKVLPAVHVHTRLTLSATPPADPTSTAAVHTRCTLNVNGPGVTCSPAYAWFYDAFFNRLDSVVCPAWVYTVRNTAQTSSAAAVSLSVTASSANTQVTSSDFMDGDLKCDFTDDTKDASVHIYGGIHSLVVNHSTIPNPLKANESNISLTNLTYMTPSYDGAGAYSLNAYPIAMNNEVINLSSSASPAAVGTTLPVVTPSFTCNFSAGGNCASPNTTDAFKMNFTKVQNGMTFTVSGRGKSYSPAAFNVTSGNAVASQSTFTLIDSSSNTKDPATITADDIFGMNIVTKDAFGNLTNTNSSADTACATTVSVDSTGVGTNGNGIAGFTAPNSNTRPSTGSYELRGMRITQVNGSSVTFTACQLAKAINFTVAPGVAKSFYLNNSSTHNKVSVDVSPCNTPLTGGGAACDVAYAYFYDNYGNNRTNDTCDQWTLTRKSADTFIPWSSTGAASATQGASVSMQVVSFSALDATLTCSKAGAVEAGGVAGLHLYGGFTHLKVAVTEAPARDANGFITAANDNVTVNSVTLRSYVNGILGDANVNGNYQISYASSAYDSPNGTKFTNTPVVSCTFTNGLCNVPKPFTFANADLVARALSPSVLGLNSLSEGDATKMNTIKVKAAPTDPARSTFTLLDAGNNPRTGFAVVAGETFGMNIASRDAFDNISETPVSGTGSCATTVTIGNVGADPALNLQGFNMPTSNSKAGTGIYEIRGMNITKSGNVRVNFAVCGVNSTITFNVSPAPAKTYYVNQSNTPSKTNSDDVPCNSLSEGGGVFCPMVYAYFYDEFDNQRVGDTCDSWTLTDKSANTSAPWASQGASASLIVSSNRALDAQLVCTKSGATEQGTTPGLHVYGGINHVMVTITDSRDANGFITAASNNFTINSLTLRSYKGGVASNSPVNGDVPITYTTTALVAPDGTPFTDTSLVTCTFSNGVCSTAKNFSFARADTTAKSLSLNVKGIQLMLEGDVNKMSTIKVKPNAVTQHTTTLPTSVLSTATFNGEIRLFDNFKNPACDDASMVYTAPASTTSPNNTAATAGTAGKTATGVYQIPANSFSLPKVNTTGYSLSFSACSYNMTQNIKVYEGALSAIKLAATANLSDVNANAAAAVSNINCVHTATSGSGVVCDPVYAY